MHVPVWGDRSTGATAATASCQQCMSSKISLLRSLTEWDAAQLVCNLLLWCAQLVLLIDFCAGLQLRRTHFHDFMLDVHSRLQVPLPPRIK